jgi:hypothetical protein
MWHFWIPHTQKIVPYIVVTTLGEEGAESVTGCKKAWAFHCQAEGVRLRRSCLLLLLEQSVFFYPSAETHLTATLQQLSAQISSKKSAPISSTPSTSLSCNIWGFHGVTTQKTPFFIYITSVFAERNVGRNVDCSIPLMSMLKVPQVAQSWRFFYLGFTKRATFYTYGTINHALA